MQLGGQGKRTRALFPSPADGGVRYICMLCMLCNIQRRASPQADGSQLSFVGFVSCAAATAHEPSFPPQFLSAPRFCFSEAQRVFACLWTPITWLAEPAFSLSCFSTLIGSTSTWNHTGLTFSPQATLTALETSAAGRLGFSLHRLKRRRSRMKSSLFFLPPLPSGHFSRLPTFPQERCRASNWRSVCSNIKLWS